MHPISGDLIETVTPHYNRRPVAAVSQHPVVGGGQLVLRNGDARQPAFGSAPWLQESSERGSKRSVNSRNGCSRLTLQTRDLDAQKSRFRGNWGDFGGTHEPLPNRDCYRVGYGTNVGTDVNVPNGLNRSPRPVRPPAPLLWNRTIPRFPAVSGSWFGKTNEVWPVPATVIPCEPSRLPLSSHMVAVILAEEADRFANATPMTNPAVLS